MASSWAPARLAKEPRHDNVLAGIALLLADSLSRELVTGRRDCSQLLAVVRHEEATASDRCLGVRARRPGLSL
jgi:hypothetical protein